MLYKAQNSKIKDRFSQAMLKPS